MRKPGVKAQHWFLDFVEMRKLNTDQMHGRILLVTNCLRSGGAEKQLLWIASEIVKMGMQCSILELVAGERSERIEAMVRVAVSDGVRVVRAPNGSGLLRGALRVRRELKDLLPQLIWSWGVRSDLVCMLNRLIRPAGSWVISNRCANKRSWTSGFTIESLIARKSDGVVSNTHAGLVSSGVYKIKATRQWILPNIARYDQNIPLVTLPDALPVPLILIMLGNIKIHHKGYDLVAELVRILRAKSLAFELRIAGRPDELVELEVIFQRLDVQPVIKFYGEVSHPEEFLREGHLFLLLSRYEGMPNTLLEALNVGLPAIATDVGDLRVMKEIGAPFVLIPCENASAAAEAVHEATANWAETKLAAAQGRRWVQEHFSEEAGRRVLRSILAEFIKL